MSTTHFAVGNVAEHSGFLTYRDGPAMFADGTQTGWTYQDVTGPHGSVLCEGTEDECKAALAEFLRCDAPSSGRYCYSHNPEP